MVISRVIKNVMSSAAEAEVGALYMNTKEVIPIRRCLEDLGHAQPPTPIKTDNTTALGIVKGTIKQKRSKAFDMSMYWLKDQTEIGTITPFWESGKTNKGDYPTKRHSGAHHQRVRPVFLYVPGKTPVTQQGCDNLLLEK